MQNKEFKRKCGKSACRVICFLITLVMVLSAVSINAFAAKKESESSKYSGVKLYPGGMAFGVKFMTKGLIVVGVSGVKNEGKEVSPANAAGIKVGDVIISANGKEIEDLKTFADVIEACNGSPIALAVTRDNKVIETELTPVKCDTDGKYKAGLWLKDSTAGIGTVTYIDPQSGEFGGLGHGICNHDTQTLIPIKRGTAMKVEIGGVVRGMAGKPGEIKGYFLPEKTGSVFCNTVCGVFGAFTELPNGLNQPIPIGTRNEVKEGKAEIISTLGSDGPQTYSIEISKISRQDRENKSFVIKITDKKLIERTGGIVQGMSGSPIIQNGKLVGAVTHVMVGDPTTGYGIFIENMLDAANQVAEEQLKKAS